MTAQSCYKRRASGDNILSSVLRAPLHIGKAHGCHEQVKMQMLDRHGGRAHIRHVQRTFDIQEESDYSNRVETIVLL